MNKSPFRRRVRRVRKPSERIADSLASIDLSLRRLMDYKEIEENRQKIYSDILSGCIPMLQKYVADALGPKHPYPPPFVVQPHRKHRKKTNSELRTS
jgi:hypothetical protein